MTENRNAAALAGDCGAPKAVELAGVNGSENTKPLITYQAARVAQQFGMLPDTAIAIAFLLFEHGRAS